MDVKDTKSGTEKLPRLLGPEEFRIAHIREFLPCLEQILEESQINLKTILGEKKDRAFTLICESPVSGKKVKLGSLKITETLSPPDATSANARLVLNRYNEQRSAGIKGKITDDSLTKAALDVFPTLRCDFTLDPSISKSSDQKIYPVLLHGIVTETTVFDHEQTGETTDLKARQTSGLPKGLFEALEKKFPFMRFVLEDENKKAEIQKKNALLSSSPANGVLQAKLRTPSIVSAGDVNTMFDHLQDTCFANGQKLIKTGDKYEINKGDKKIGEIKIKKISGNQSDLPDEKCSLITEVVEQEGFSSLRKTIHELAKEEIGCLVHADLTLNGSAESIPVIFLVAHCPLGKNNDIPLAIQENGNRIVDFGFMLNSNSGKKDSVIENLFHNSLLIKKDSG